MWGDPGRMLLRTGQPGATLVVGRYRQQFASGRGEYSFERWNTGTAAQERCFARQP